MPILQPDQIYQLLRNLTSPVVAITSERGGKRNVMDTGSSTCFLGDVVAVGHGAADRPSGTVMTAAHFRTNMPAEWRGEYEALLRAAQAYAAERSRDIRPLVWKGLQALE